MKYCFWKKKFTNYSNVGIEVGPFCTGLWKQEASRLWEWYEWFLCSLKVQMDVNTQTLVLRKTPWEAWCQKCGHKQFLFLFVIPAHKKSSGLSPPGLLSPPHHPPLHATHPHLPAPSWAPYGYTQITLAFTFLSAFQGRVAFPSDLVFS